MKPTCVCSLGRDECDCGLTDDQRRKMLDLEEQEQRNGLEGAEWAFIWACLTIAFIGLLALIGVLLRQWPNIRAMLPW